MSIRKLTELDLANKRVLIREDFNVPMQNSEITSDARIKAALPTIKYTLEKGAKVILMSHRDRPKEGEYQVEHSLAPVATRLAALLNLPVKFVVDWSKGVDAMKGEVILLENVRFLKGEKQNDPILAKNMAALCDIFVMDAFATAHRAEASTVGVAQYAPIACAGLLLHAEITALKQALEKPARPLLAIIGGSKVSTKLTVLSNLLTKVDQLIVGGGIANTFLAAKGFAIGKSLAEPDLINEAKRLLAMAEQNKIEILLPSDVVVAKEFSANAKPIIKLVDQVAADEMILDVGPKTAQIYRETILKAKTILWNGPVGVFEFAAFAAGTKALAQAIAESTAYSLAGGGDTIAAIEAFGISEKISYISTGGGAFLEFVEGKELPGVKYLKIR